MPGAAEAPKATPPRKRKLVQEQWRVKKKKIHMVGRPPRAQNRIAVLLMVKVKSLDHAVVVLMPVLLVAWRCGKLRIPDGSMPDDPFDARRLLAWPNNTVTVY
jgi:hypothetical protein